jgi:hypothetical protein
MTDVPTNPMAQDYTIISSHGKKYRTDGPSLLKLQSGRLVCTYVLFDLDDQEKYCRGKFPALDYDLETVVATSDDNGITWSESARVSGELAITFTIKGKLYLLGFESARGSLIIYVSEDEGGSFSGPSVLIEGRFWNTSTGKAVVDNRLYWCVGCPNDADEFNSTGSRTAVICADISKDIMKPDAWRISNTIVYPGTPNTLWRAGKSGDHKLKNHDHWLEGNVAFVGGMLKAYWRVRIDGQATAGICAICDIKDDGKNISYSFDQFYPLPGAQNHFHIIRDEKTELYWMTSNLPTTTRDDFNKGLYVKNWPSRLPLLWCVWRLLTLHLSFDGLNWLPAGYIVIWPKQRQSSNYVTPVIDGDDLIIASRSSIDAPNYHDNDTITFHRIKDFRKLADPLIPTE